MAKAETEGLIAWHKTEIERLKTELASLEKGSARVGKKAPDGDWEDITDTHSAWLKEKIVELDDLIIKYSFEI